MSRVKTYISSFLAWKISMGREFGEAVRWDYDSTHTHILECSDDSWTEYIFELSSLLCI